MQECCRCCTGSTLPEKSRFLGFLNPRTRTDDSLLFLLLVIFGRIFWKDSFNWNWRTKNFAQLTWLELSSARGKYDKTKRVRFTIHRLGTVRYEWINRANNYSSLCKREIYDGNEVGMKGYHYKKIYFSYINMMCMRNKKRLIRSRWIKRAE